MSTNFRFRRRSWTERKLMASCSWDRKLLFRRVICMHYVQKYTVIFLPPCHARLGTRLFRHIKTFWGCFGAIPQKMFEILHENLYILVLFSVICVGKKWRAKFWRDESRKHALDPLFLLQGRLLPSSLNRRHCMGFRLRYDYHIIISYHIMWICYGASESRTKDHQAGISLDKW